MQKVKERADCKVLAGKKQVKPRIKWWKLKKDCCIEFRKELRQAIGVTEELPKKGKRACID